MEEENIIIFPKVKEKWKEKAFQAVEGENYAEALSYIDQLISYDNQDIDVIIAKMICHMQIGQTKDAIMFAEEIVDELEGNAFFTLLFYYITAMFEEEQYSDIVHYIDQLEKEQTITEVERSKYFELYQMSLLYVKKEEAILWQKVAAMLEEENWKKAFIFLKKWNELQRPVQDTLFTYINSNIHEAIKAFCWQILQERKVNDWITVNKFGQQFQANPMVDRVYNPEAIEALFDQLDQIDPVSASFIRQLYDHYVYIVQPLQLPDNLEPLTDGLQMIYESMFSPMELKSVNNPYVQQIVLADQLYREIFDH